MLIRTNCEGLRHPLHMTTMELVEALPLRVQNEQFSEEKGFILRYAEKDV